MEIDALLRLMARQWWVLLATLLVFATTSVVWTETREPVYASTSTGLVVFDGESVRSDLDEAAKSRATTYAALAITDATAMLAAQKLGTDADPASLLTDIDVEVTAETALIQISAQATTPKKSDALANAWLTALSERVDQIEKRATPSPVAARLVVVESAVGSDVPVYPRGILNLGIGLMAGLVVGALIALYRDPRRRQVSSAPEMGDDSGAELLAALPRLSRPRGRRVPVFASLDDRGAPEAAEQLRDARLKLTHAPGNRVPVALLVTSAAPGQGTSTVALNLAAAFAAAQQPTVLVEADLEHPSMAEDLDLDPELGLWQVLEGTVPLESALQDSLDQPGLRHLVAGAQSLRGPELLGSEAMLKTMASLRADGLVIIDVPAVLASSSASVMCELVDGVIVVTPPVAMVDELTRALEKLDIVGAEVLGLISTEQAPRARWGRGGKRPQSRSRKAASQDGEDLPDPEGSDDRFPPSARPEPPAKHSDPPKPEYRTRTFR